jgi:UDP-N-acetylmuramate dehydrogenase
MAALSKLHHIIREEQVSYFVLGWGSNLLFSDAQFDGVVIRMKHLFTECESLSSVGNQTGTFLKLGASLGASSLLKKASDLGYGGLTCLTGIPGSVGGMVAMNAGTHLGEIGTQLVQSEFVNLADEKLKVKTRIHETSDFSYRNNHFLKSGDLITHTFIKYSPESPEAVKQQIDELYLRRKNTQPVNYPSCGSVFMNPREKNMHAWQVIDRLELRGFQIGGAQFSEKHSNFIVNLGNAKASDVKALIELAKSRALLELEVNLHEEVKYIP